MIGGFFNLWLLESRVKHVSPNKKKPKSLSINQETNGSVCKSSLSAFIDMINICLLRHEEKNPPNTNGDHQI